MNKNSNKKGFTLIEVLVSMLVLSVVLAMTLPVITRQKQSGSAEKWDYSINLADISYSNPAVNTEDVTIGTTDINNVNSRLTVQPTVWRRPLGGLTDTPPAMIIQTLNQWGVLSFSPEIPNNVDANGNRIDDIFEYQYDTPSSSYRSAKIIFSNVNAAGTLTNNIGIGRNALSRTNSNTAINNVAIGKNSQTSNISSINNVSIGSDSLASLVNDGTGENVAVGVRSLRSALGRSNVAVGTEAGRELTGRDNVMVGNRAGASLGNTVGSDENVFIGTNAGSGVGAASGVVTGTRNIFIGSNASYNGAGAGATPSNNLLFISNRVSVDPSFFTPDSTIISGMRLPVLFASVDQFDLPTVRGPVRMLKTRNFSATQIIANREMITSDERLKDILGIYKRGLSDILKIEPVVFNYKQDKNLPKQDTNLHAGVIAQDLQKIMPESVAKGNDGYYNVSYQDINMASLNAIKELKHRNDSTLSRIEKLEQKVKIQKEKNEGK